MFLQFTTDTMQLFWISDWQKELWPSRFEEDFKNVEHLQLVTTDVKWKDYKTFK
jgi:hypothetical protein